MRPSKETVTPIPPEPRENAPRFGVIGARGSTQDTEIFELDELFADFEPDAPVTIPQTSPREISAQLRAVIKQAESIPVADYEEPGADLTALVGAAAHCLENATAVLDLALDFYDATPTPSVRGAEAGLMEGGLAGEVERRMARKDGIPKLTSLAFVARIGLRARGQSLSRLDAVRHREELLSACGSIVRDARKALDAVDFALCQVERLPPDLSRRATALAWSLRTRAAYVSFRRDVLSDDLPAPAALRARLRLAGASIAKLLGRSFHQQLRISDRAMLRATMARIRAWLAATAHAAEEHAAEGIRLFQDLANLANLMLSVNRRSELIEHDRFVLASAEALCDGELGPLVAALAPLEGRDADLDALLRSPAESPRDRWRAVIAAARARLEQAQPDAEG